MGIAAHSKRLYPNLCPHSWCTSCFYQSWSAIERPLSDRVTTHHEPLVFPLWREWKWGWLYLLKNVCKNRVPSILPSYFQQGHKVIWPSIFPKKKKESKRFMMGRWACMPTTICFGIHNSHSLRVMNSFLQNIALGTMTDTSHTHHYSLAFLRKQK